MNKPGASKLTIDSSNSQKPKFIYVVYIASTVEKVWQALTDPKMTEQYWFGYQISSDWKVGSRYTAGMAGAPPFDKGIVLECDPPRRLSYTWHPQYEAFLHERHSRVTFELVQLESQVQLTVTHDEFDEGSKVFESISGGWPRVLSSLKSWLETGRGLPRSWSDADKKWQTCATETCSAEARA